MGSNGQGWGISVDPWIRIRKINLPAEGVKTSHKIMIISSLRYILDSFIKECGIRPRDVGIVKMESKRRIQLLLNWNQFDRFLLGSNPVPR